ncbi:4Fe-4S binding protein [Geosporobacter ferrireducens]|uniref:Ferredoxin n=1 Tax=Geosporobacter ferrireducens TaxID=1424294 RepID=A0A1D8GHB3_9FIRM|nr:4Fe-4S binding protein [Geosporobacter ferrireducens]AOT70302.1 ferredoxin [Geosporobacter ferrireducens]MTI54269.1 4Fe-4S dicluster domain-containing protein [Geosporobacter ferrireducens]
MANKKTTPSHLEEILWKDAAPGGVIYEAGNAEKYKTGAWRSMKPIWNEEKCKHCMLCFPVCPDSSILVKDQKMTGIDYDHCKGCGVCVEVCPFKVFDYVVEE